MKNPCYAHRGWSGRAPENTLSAIELALELNHVAGIEIDVQLSRDGVPVVIHDFTLERTTNGSGWVKDTDFMHLRMLDAGSWFSSEFKGETIPSLEEVLRLVKGRCKLNIELKTAGIWYPDISERVTGLIRNARMEDQVWISSFDHGKVRQVRRYSSRVETGLIIAGLPLMMQEQMREADATYISMDYLFIEADFIKRMQALGNSIMVWTVNRLEHIKGIAKIDPNIVICTNHPELMQTE